MKILKWVLRAPVYLFRVVALIAAIYLLYRWMTNPFQDFAIQRHSFVFYPAFGIQLVGAYFVYEPAKDKSKLWKAGYIALAVFTVYINQITTFHWWLASMLAIVWPLRGTNKLMLVAGAGFLYHVLVGLFGGEPFSMEVLTVCLSMATFSAVHLYLSRKGEGDGHGAHGGHAKKDAHKKDEKPSKKTSKRRTPDEPKDAW